jgi:hypothetical protein
VCVRVSSLLARVLVLSAERTGAMVVVLVAGAEVTVVLVVVVVVVVVRDWK